MDEQIRPYLWNQRRPLMLVFGVFWTGTGVRRSILLLVWADSRRVTLTSAGVTNNVGGKASGISLVIVLLPIVRTFVVTVFGVVAVVVNVIYANRGFGRSLDGLNSQGVD